MKKQDFPWLHYYDAETPANVDYRELPLFGVLDEAATSNPKRAAIIFRNKKISYAALQRQAERLAYNLRENGLTPGDRVAIMLPNLPQTIITFWAVLKAGAIVVMTNPLYMEKELVHQLNDSGATFMVTLDHLWPKVAPIMKDVGVKKYIVTSISDGLGFPLNVLYRFKAKREGLNLDIPFDGRKIIPWRPLTKGSNQFSIASIKPTEDLALLQYTGGTTGISKGVMLTHQNMVVNVQQCQAMLHAIGGARHESFLGLLPYFHIYGLTVCLTFATSMGATLIPFPRYVPQDVLNAIHKFKPTIFPGVPAVYMSLMQQKSIGNYQLSSIDYCISGSAPMPVDGMRRFQKLTGAEIIEGYGLSEASPVTHLNPLKGNHKSGSIGVPFPDTLARIVDMELGGMDVPQGKAGELIIKGPQVMKGYWNRPEDTANTLRDGWLYTGDIAVMDEQGYFTIVDRKKDMALVGGYNVYPREIDELLLEHEKVKEVVAVGVPHGPRGEFIKVFVVPEDGVYLEKSEIISFCRKHLANYKVPKQVEFRTELPKTAVGKVLRRVLRDQELAKRQKP